MTPSYKSWVVELATTSVVASSAHPDFHSTPDASGNNVFFGEPSNKFLAVGAYSGLFWHCPTTKQNGKIYSVHAGVAVVTLA